MRLIEVDGRYEAESSYDERTIPKAVGFRWGPAAKDWYTNYPDVAANAKIELNAKCKGNCLKAGRDF